MNKNKTCNMPSHIAFILDGNGRWAIRRKLSRIEGHKAGVKHFESLIKECSKYNIKAVSLYAFSTENWKRDSREVEGIFDILEDSLDKCFANLVDNNYKFITSGNIDKLRPSLRDKIISLTSKSANNSGLIINLCVNYGSKEEIIRAINLIIDDKKDKIELEDFEKYLYTFGLPPLDLVIRTSGEQRLSGFMLWQCAYAEFYFTKTLWPDFNVRLLNKALKNYSKRSRRYGGEAKK